MSADLAARCLAECDRRDTLSAAATRGPWMNVAGVIAGEITPISHREVSAEEAHIRRPDAALIEDARNSYDRMTTWARREIYRHWSTRCQYRNGEPYDGCGHCAYMDGVRYRYPCASVLAVAAALGVEAER